MFKWTEFRQDNIDLLNALVPDASLPFTIDSLKVGHKKFNGKLCHWVEYMNDRHISGRHVVIQVITNHWYSTSSEWGGRWRLLYSLAEYAETWKQSSWSDIRAEYATSHDHF